MNRYPNPKDDKNPTLKSTLDFICRERLNDVRDNNNLPNNYMTGRRVVKVPSASTDITSPVSYAGDFNITVDYAYFCISDAADSGAIKWVRVAAGTF